MSAREELAAAIWNARNPGSRKWEHLTSAERCMSDVRDIADAILASDWLAKQRDAAVLDYVMTKETPRIRIETTEMQDNIIAMAVATERERIAVAIEVECDHDGRNGKTWCCRRCHEAANTARATTATEAGT